MTDHPAIYGLVLAGGESRRMGHDKALLNRDGQSQLEYAYSLLQGVVDQCFVSTRAEQKNDAERGRFPQIVDRHTDIGPVAGILSALETHSDVDWLIVACDLPNLDRRTLEYLIANRSDEKPFTAFRSSHDDLPEPLCAIYRAGSDAVVRGFVEDGMICPRKILIRSDTRLLEQPNPAALDNINTPDELEESILRAAQ
jgi:molybdopterin-guanine dinucleotide biosynthesis protein A